MDGVFRLGAGVGRPWKGATVAIGNFDGVHRGHQDLIRATVQHAKPSGLAAVALTFDPHPARVVVPDARTIPTLTSLPRRAQILRDLGIEFVAVVDFSAAIASLSPGQFARDVLVGQLAARRIVVGEDFRFGAGRAGDAEELRRLGLDLGFDVEERPRVFHGGEAISSSRVRDALAGGKVDHAWALCGRPFRLDGVVVKGEGRGRTIGFPTANLDTPSDHAVPGLGVYACRAFREGLEGIPAVVDVGVRPTFSDHGLPRVEAHLVDFAGDLYGQRLGLDFIARIRGEVKFATVDDLTHQIRRDIVDGLTSLEKTDPFLG